MPVDRRQQSPVFFILISLTNNARASLRGRCRVSLVVLSPCDSLLCVNDAYYCVLKCCGAEIGSDLSDC